MKGGIDFMKLKYEEPEIEIRNYPLPPVLTEVSYTDPDTDIDHPDPYPDIWA